MDTPDPTGPPGGEPPLSGLPAGWRSLRWERDTRYYAVRLAQDLWGDWIITRVWGRRGSALGRIVHQPCASYAQALAVLEQVARRRRQRHYVLVSGGEREGVAGVGGGRESDNKMMV